MLCCTGCVLSERLLAGRPWGCQSSWMPGSRSAVGCPPVVLLVYCWRLPSGRPVECGPASCSCCSRGGLAWGIPRVCGPAFHICSKLCLAFLCPARCWGFPGDGWWGGCCLTVDFFVPVFAAVFLVAVERRQTWLGVASPLVVFWLDRMSRPPG